jgi:NADH:ubiquinone oxidoreductase subunit 6 (subunit J)
MELQFIQIVGIFIFAYVLFITILFFISMDDMKKKCNMKSSSQMSFRDLIIYIAFALFVYVIIGMLYNTYDTPKYKQYRLFQKRDIPI